MREYLRALGPHLVLVASIILVAFFGVPAIYYFTHGEPFIGIYCLLYTAFSALCVAWSWQRL